MVGVLREMSVGCYRYIYIYMYKHAITSNRQAVLAELLMVPRTGNKNLKMQKKVQVLTNSKCVSP